MLMAYRRTVVARFDIQEVSMFKSEISRRFATLVCTVLFSATCVAGAVGPATGGHQTTVANAARLTA